MTYDRFTVATRARGLALLVCLAGLGVNARAASTVVSAFHPDQVVLPGGGWGIRPGTSSLATATPARVWASAGQGAGAKILATDAVTLAGRAGPFVVNAVSSIAVKDAALAIASAALLPEIAAVATAGMLFYDAYRIYNEGGSLFNDPGANPKTVSIPGYSLACGFGSDSLCGNPARTFTGGSRQEVCDAFAGSVNKAFPVDNFYVKSPYKGVVDGDACKAQNLQEVRLTGVIISTQVSSKTCPASIDASNPAYSVPEGAAPGIDGLCATARYNHKPVSPQQAADIVAAAPAGAKAPPDLGKMGQATQEAIASGQKAPADLQTSGPASQVGQPTSSVTVNPDGSTVTKSDTPTYNYGYAGDTINVSEGHVIVSQTCTGAGSCSTTTTTTVAPSTAPAPTPKDPEPECPDGSTRVGCASLGDAPTEKVPAKNSPANWTSENVSLPSACPTPQTIRGMVFEYAPICDAATNARPWVLIGAAFSALMLMLAAIRTI